MLSKRLTTLLVLSLGLLSQTNASFIRNRQYNNSNNQIPDRPTYTASDSDVLDRLNQQSVENLKEHMRGENLTHSKAGYKCSLSDIVIRREWGSLSKSERKDYTDAVLCLTKKPSQSDPSLVPGARSRYDDFVSIHINQTLFIHSTANFLSWHRYFVWHYEQVLRNECGYKGYHPYWDWSKYASNPEASPVFDGSPYSMSGNGAYIPGRNDTFLFGGITVPPQNGGGCITSGPFKDMKVHLGPVAPIMKAPANPLSNGFGYNPRCLKRDIGNFCSLGWTKTSDVADLILNYTDIASFQNRMQGDFPHKFMGVHAAGHFTIAGDPGGDFYASPGDPIFFLHHGMIDRVWWIWQMLDYNNRIMTIDGTLTMFNTPPSRNGTLEDTINLGVIAPEDIRLRELMSTVDGPFCYIYL